MLRRLTNYNLILCIVFDYVGTCVYQLFYFPFLYSTHTHVTLSKDIFSGEVTHKPVVRTRLIEIYLVSGLAWDIKTAYKYIMFKY